MSTRAHIARLTGPDDWVGVYHHFDGYPSGLGAALFEMYRGHFARDLKVMLRWLIDDHPAGWSCVIDCDLSLEPGYVPMEAEQTHEGHTRARCYCHGMRSEPPMPVSPRRAAWAEWAYVFDDAATMHIYVANDAAGVGVWWRRVASIALNGPAPDWAALDGCGDD